MIRLDNELKKEKEKSTYEWIRQNCLPQELVNKLYIPIQKIKDKIEQLKEKEESDFRSYGFAVEAHLALQVLQELLERKN